LLTGNRTWRHSRCRRKEAPEAEDQLSIDDALNASFDDYISMESIVLKGSMGNVRGVLNAGHFD
tara:strand:+ start:296 stop:487 length:192 start_codon:yes stop_codon:yes gene_type:complete